jgi:dihydrodipicolinate synthase/N-acetylneuraminate lyase
VYSERYYGDDNVVSYYTALAEATDLPLLVHAIPMRLASSGPTQVQPFSLALLERLFAIDTVVGIKEENGLEVLRQQILHHYAASQAIVLAGGAMRNFLASQPFGADSWLVGLGNLFPAIEYRFESAVQAGDLAAARSIVFDQEAPFFDVAVPIGWHTALKATLDILGLMPGHEREPLPRPTGAQRESLLAVCARLGWQRP